MGGGVARKVKSGYVGVNGVARKFFKPDPKYRFKTYYADGSSSVVYDIITGEIGSRQLTLTVGHSAADTKGKVIIYRLATNPGDSIVYIPKNSTITISANITENVQDSSGHKHDVSLKIYESYYDSYTSVIDADSPTSVSHYTYTVRNSAIIQIAGASRSSNYPSSISLNITYLKINDEVLIG